VDEQNFDYEQANEILRHSWEVHRQAFGPILEPAFAENEQARIRLTAALNHISRREVKQGFDMLQSLKGDCLYDADRAAWFFFMGLCFEMAGEQKQMTACYCKAAEFGHRFYLPYLKVARFAHLQADFDLAEQNYRIGIECLLEMDEDERENTVLASAYTNLCSCLTMMHRYDQAEQALSKAAQLPVQPASAATAAILYAAMGQSDKTALCIAQLEHQRSELAQQTKEMTAQIMAGEHPHFSPVLFENEGIPLFWQWFVRNEMALYCLPNQEEYRKVYEALAEWMQKLFPFLERQPRLTIRQQEGKWELLLSDRYAVGLNFGFLRLLAARPKELDERWKFRIVH